MRISIRALAQVSSKPINPLPPNLRVLPPLTLYRRILRAHRKYLPEQARYLGDRYVKAEFHRTTDTDNPVHIIGFLTQWQEYCQAVEGEHWKDGKVDMSLIEKMSDEQLGQMYELMKAVKGEEGETSEIEIPEKKQ